MTLPLAHVVLVRPEIPWNTGNAGRTCLAAGAQLHLVGPLGFSLRDRDVRRAGLDYWPRVKPRLWENWDEFEARLPELGEPFLFTTAGRTDLWSADLPAHSVLIFGPEGIGLPRALLARYPERLVRIPMVDDDLRSINLSTAVGIALYEWVRRRRMTDAQPTSS
jgi:tRNA (cytidine/uridine-2'-O-)-methyltransferase